ncbi:DNA polymerase III subunit gamma/tau [Pyruvatibacter sp.]|uniref:DNA polymerase III subunit gamma/tau n=1 Tax=Pyruvatibacter sp. TaxID=1981328 RepID=UPI0032ED38D8
MTPPSDTSVDDKGPEEGEPNLGMTAEDGGFDLLGGEAKAPAAPVEYQVLARKYRPQTFDDLVGQDAMVRTLHNAFATNRIAHAFILTGVRGIGKTTTARILARALNYEADGFDGPTIDMPGPGINCQAIMESRHQDVLEMDAASRTGIGDIREIIESVRYAPTSARYKVYIIDEVHMLSNAAFNGLLKTLEEPPAHVKFIFATTEIRKVPVTVLSRCQRFDLRRLDTEAMSQHLANIAGKEGVSVDDGALALIGRAAEGSVRDGLSLLDQAIAHGTQGETISADSVRAMLGLADRGRVFDLYEHVMKGDVASALGELTAQYQDGADPAVVISDMAELTHWLTRLKLVDAAADDKTVSDMDRKRGTDMVATLSVKSLARTWQMLLKGLGEVERAPWPLAAAEMVLVRLAYAADLPTPDELIKKLQNAPTSAGAGGSAGTQAADGGRTSAMMPTGARPTASVGSSAPQSASRMAQTGVQTAPQEELPPRIQLKRFEDVVALAENKRDVMLQNALEHDVRLVAFAPGRIELAVLKGDSSVIQQLSAKLQSWTNERWFVTQARQDAPVAQPTIAEARRDAQDALMASISAEPLVKAALETFPGAKIIEVRDLAADAAAEAATSPAPTDGDDNPDTEDLI